MKRPFPLLVLVPMLLACGGQSSGEASSSAETETFTEKEISVRYVDKKLDQKTKLRFYSGSKDVPYISIAEFYGLLLKGRSSDPARSKLDVKVNGSVYTVTSPSNGKAAFDVDGNIMSSDYLPFFTSTKTYASGLSAMLGTDGMPWMKVGEIKVDGKAKATTVDFDDYGINLHGDGKDLYLPLPTLQDIFSDSDLLTSLYNRQDLFIYSAGDESTNSFGKDTYEPALKTDLGVEYATYLYNELCFDYDVFLGRPGRSSLERYYDLSKGLDHALESRPLGRLAKQYLTDGTVLGYATGLYLFGQLTADAGHTRVDPFISYVYDEATQSLAYPSWARTLLPQVSLNVTKIRRDGYEELSNYAASYNHHEELRTNRKDVLKLTKEGTGNLRGEETYLKVNNTAFIFIDDYMGEYQNAASWKEFYAGAAELPYGEHVGGSVVSLYNGLLKAQKDPAVKNVVVDLASNTGGSVDEMMYVISLLTENKIGKTEFSLENRITGEHITAALQFDRNLDRKFDEKDAVFDPVKGKNVAVLMSQNGYSCGGISPIYLHDRGIFTMGDISGGGSCSVLCQHTGVGLRTIRSACDATVDKNGRKIDDAREGSCDHKFEIKTKEQEGTTVLDFSAFYDIADIERVLNEHFSAK
ncbi:MAG: hypothetical protein E7182_04280 [Erysipelotrichaceae bacterium]|nr:hypothetical protein [Erysipelotrichaceae bacterium]